MKYHQVPYILNSSSKFYRVIKRFIYTLDNGFCHICHQKVTFNEANLDHILPKCGCSAYMSGTNEYWNLRIAHLKCNVRRSNGRIGGQLRLPLVEYISIGDITYEMP